MARKHLNPRISPVFPADVRELVHLAAQAVRTSDTQFVRDAATYRAAVTLARERSPRQHPNLEEMYVDLLMRVERLEEQVRELGGTPTD